MLSLYLLSNPTLLWSATSLPLPLIPWTTHPSTTLIAPLRITRPVHSTSYHAPPKATSSTSLFHVGCC